MINIDLIFVSNGSKNKHRNMTKNAVKHAIRSVPGCNVIVCDVPPFHYDGATTIYPDEPFNYNRYLNEGADHGDSELIGFFNNDVVFHLDWFYFLTKEMDRLKLDSASPICTRTHPIEYGIRPNTGNVIGCQVGKHISGWAIIMRRDFWNKVGRLDEGSSFWCSDNRYQKQLIAAKGKHALITSSQVDHLGSQTLRDVKGKRRQDYTMQDVRNFNREFGENMFGWGQ